MNFKEIFNKTSNKDKNKFLFDLLLNNATLRKEFLDNVKITEIKLDLTDYSGFNENIISNYEEYKDMMESLELEETDWEDYTPRHSGYIEDWEAAQHMAEDEADEMFSFFEENIVSLFLGNKLEEVLEELISFYFAAKDAEINDPYENLGCDYFIDKHKGFMQYTIDKISQGNINDEKIINAISLFFKYFESQNEERHRDIKNFEQLLVLLINKMENNDLLLPIEKLTTFNSKHCPLLAVSIEEKLGDISAWLQKANKTLFDDTEIGKKLLGYYLDENFTEYLNVAKNLFNHNKEFWAEIISKNIKITNDKDFYKDIHFQLCISTNKIIHYLNIKTILTEDEKLNLHENLGYKIVFRVKIYETEKQFDKIKQLTEENADAWAFNKIIEPILNKYPEFCFKLIKDKAEEKIERERGRGTYSTIASWLLQAKKIISFESQTQDLINNLYNHKPNLPALKDEFRQSGVV